MNTVVWVIMVTVYGPYSIPTALDFETKHKCEAAIASINVQGKLQGLSDSFTMHHKGSLLPMAWCARVEK